MGTAEARQHFVSLEQKGAATAGSIPVPKDPALVFPSFNILHSACFLQHVWQSC